MKNRTMSAFPSSTSHTYVATFNHHLHMVFMSLNLKVDTQELDFRGSVLACFIAIIKPFFIHCFCLRITSFTWWRQWPQGRCTGRQGMLTSLTHLIPPGISRGPCFPNFCFVFWFTMNRSLFVLSSPFYAEF